MYLGVDPHAVEDVDVSQRAEEFAGQHRLKVYGRG
jgi:hypothetical protein